MNELDRLKEGKVGFFESYVSIFADYITKRLKEQDPNLTSTYRTGLGICSTYLKLNIKGHMQGEGLLRKVFGRKLASVEWVNAGFGSPKTTVSVNEPSIRKYIPGILDDFERETGISVSLS